MPSGGLASGALCIADLANSPTPNFLPSIFCLLATSPQRPLEPLRDVDRTRDRRSDHHRQCSKIQRHPGPSRPTPGAKELTKAEPLLREAFAVRESTQPDAWTTFNTQSLLGGVLLGQEKYTDAEPLLLGGYQGTKAREKTIPPQDRTRIGEAIERLIELYTATDRLDEAKKWIQELEDSKATKKKP